MASDLIPDLNRRIVFFDGECVLCNRTVGFLLQTDRRKRLAFASLQGVTAKALLFDVPQGDEGTIVFWERGDRYFKSEAVVRLLRACGGLPSFLGWVLSVVPRRLRDWVYSWVARHRLAVFGKQECFLPPAGDSRFLS